jgi:farnesyl diphosphate synthase
MTPAFETALTRHAAAIEASLDGLLPEPAGPQARLHEAMRYAALGGGKRLRPFLVAAGSAIFDVPEQQASRVGSAIELIHCYSLVHDDLPAMDDAETRRGRPSCHRQFDEATAILVGDALQALAFEVLADERTNPDAAVRASLVADLARAAGAAGMCGGQMLDLEAETRSLDLEQIVLLQRLKTGALFRFACESGAVLGSAPEEARLALRGFADDLGLAFQIKDDLLDVESDAATLGKASGKDAAAGKATFPGVWGVEKSRQLLSDNVAGAVEAASALPGGGGLLPDLARFVGSRTS